MVFDLIEPAWGNRGVVGSTRFETVGVFVAEHGGDGRRVWQVQVRRG